MQTEFVQSTPVSIAIANEDQMPTVKLRYPRIPLKLNDYSQTLRGRQMTIVYRNGKVNYSKVIACPLAVEDTLNIGIEKIRASLITHKLSLSDVIDVKVNHSIGHDACKAIVRRAVASRY